MFSAITDAVHQLSPQMRRLLVRVSSSKPRVQCITNTVVQALSANVLLAVGAVPSMGVHKDEIAQLSLGADAILVNLGTLDPVREMAIGALIAQQGGSLGPMVLDPVFVDRSSLRLALAKRLLAFPRVILKGNATEMAVLSPFCPAGITRITTGVVDQVVGSSGTVQVGLGHPLMASVTGMGCALGGLIAAFAAVEPDPVLASQGALTLFGLSGQLAGQHADGPGSFAVHFLDALWGLSEATREER